MHVQNIISCMSYHIRPYRNISIDLVNQEKCRKRKTKQSSAKVKGTIDFALHNKLRENVLLN